MLLIQEASQTKPRADNRAQQQRLDSVAALVTDRLANLRAVIELRQDRGFSGAGRDSHGEGKQFHDRIRRVIGQMEDAETSLLKEREQLARRSSAIAKLVIIGGGFLACGLVGLALFAIRRDFAGRTRAERALRDARQADGHADPAGALQRRADYPGAHCARGND